MLARHSRIACSGVCDTGASLGDEGGPSRRFRIPEIVLWPTPSTLATAKSARRPPLQAPLPRGSADQLHYSRESDSDETRSGPEERCPALRPFFAPQSQNESYSPKTR